MKSMIWTTIAVAGLVAAGTTPAFASSSQAPWYCSLPVVGSLLCPPAPGGGGGGNSVPEPTSLIILAAGAGLAGAAARRRRTRK
ncbi:MAG: PEP-CTERM sorting domain-containing protein [Proteobacteria bacterium]|nr:PEP-CTERM sorting domain-containing protein [Pseudomonadota bacterium]